MKRKVIQVADSTSLISLPMKWIKKHGIKKGDELDVEIKGNQLAIRTEGEREFVKKEIDMKKYSVMIKRAIHALYKKGVDEIVVILENASQFELVQHSISKETVGFEIVDQGKNTCVIKAVASNIEDFDSLLKRIFLIQITMGKDTLEALKEKDKPRLKQVRFMEETNNRLTTMCRRLLNKRTDYDEYIGAIYYIVEDFENLADEYKYLIDYYIKQESEPKISNDVFEIIEDVNNLMSDYFTLFYSFNPNLVAKIGTNRKEIISKIHHVMEKKPNNVEIVILAHMMTSTQKIFCMVGPSILIKT